MSDIENKLSRVDLNLLISLSVLLQERNVSRAAERLFLSQSAMSRTLQRLRDVFADPLFYRTANGIVPTIKALEIAKKLPELLFRLNEIFDTTPFEPSTCNKKFYISLPSLMCHAFILPLMMQVGKQAPNICISEYPVRIDPLKPLATGKLDFAIHIKKPNDKDYNAIEIGTFIPTIYARKGHPILSVKTDRLAQCFNYNFAELIIENDENSTIKNPLEMLLAEQKITRKITVRSSQLRV